MEAKKEGQLLEIFKVTEPVAIPELGSRVVEAVMNMRQAKYPICWLQNVDFLELPEEHKTTHEKWSLDYVDLVMTESTTSPGYGSWVVETLMSMRKTMYPIRLFRNADFLEILE